MLRRKCIPLRLVLIGWLLSAAANHAAAIGWDSNDFLITGGPNFPDRIGVFDFDLTFKGYLETNFLTVGGIDFDAAGNLVAASSVIGAFRVYSSAGNQIGGFTFTLPGGSAGRMKVASDGTYLLPNQNGGTAGVLRYSPDGTFLGELGTGDPHCVTVIPGNKLWTGKRGITWVTELDFPSGATVTTIPLTGPVERATSLAYLRASNTVLVGDSDAHRVVERDLNGVTIHRYETPFIDFILSSTIGPNGDVFATASDRGVLRWQRDGTYLGENAASEVFGGSSILWAGNVPEPGTAGMAMIGVAAIFARRASRA